MNSIRPLKSKPFSEIKNLELSYLDNSLNYINTSFSTAEAFDFSLYNALENFNDFTVNNYSYFFLGKKDLFSNWIKPSTKENITTGYISSFRFILDGNPSFLYFDRTSVRGTPGLIQTWDASFNLKTFQELNVLSIDPANIEQHQNYLFVIEYIPGTNKCYIKHIDGAIDFYLYNRKIDERYSGSTGGPVDDLWFTTNSDIYQKFGQFNYVITGNSFLLFFSENDSVKVILENDISIWVNYYKNIQINPDNSLELIRPTDLPEKYWYYVPDEYIGKKVQIVEYGRIRSLCPDITVPHQLRLIDNKSLLPIITENDITYNTTISISTNNVNIDNYINTSWLSYKDRNYADINSVKSEFNIESQCLFHLQYNNINNKFNTTLNIIPLKNNISPKNNVIRGDYLQTGNKNDPNVDFREYTTIETGSNQEFGNSNITLNYIFYDIEYKVNAGEDLVFNTKENNSLTGGLENSLYPFINLNINDTKFVKNGAFGSTSPFLADKFKKLQKNSQFTNNGRYLYTWLYQSKNNPYGIWLDRYYYPNIISKEEALKGKINFDPASFSDIIDKNYIVEDPTFISFIENAPYFDKQSDLVIEPNTQYIYSRLGKEEINSILDDIEIYKENAITSFISGENKIQQINNLNIKNSGCLDLNFNMYLAPDKQFGLDFLSNSPTSGLSIKNEQNITPFIYTFENITTLDDKITNTLINLHNFKFEQVKTIDLFALYGLEESIVSLALNKPFEDFIVLTDKSFYIIGFDLSIKERFDLNDLFGDSKVEKIYINKNIVYFIINKLYYKSICYLNLNANNIQIIEVKRYNSFSKLGYKVNDIKNDTLFPLYYNNPGEISNSEGNIIIDHVDPNGKVVYKTVFSKKYPLPIGLGINELVYISDKNDFDLKYWYYAPIFDIGAGLSDNSLYIKNLYIDDTGTVFAFNYFILSNKLESNTLYGVREKVEGALYQVENINLDEYKGKEFDRGDSDIIFAAYNKIYNISVDSLNRLAILKKQATSVNSVPKIELLLFDKAKRPINTFILGNTYDELYCLDSIRTYNNGNSANYFTLFANTYDKEEEKTFYYALLVDENYNLSEIELNYSVSNRLEKMVDYNKVLTESLSNNLNFTLNLPKNSLLSDKFIYTFNLDNIIAGWYNIHILVDLNEGIYEVYINEKLIPIKQSFLIDKHVYNVKNVFNYPFILGTTAYRNGITLDKFLGLEEEMPFSSINLRIKDLSLYFKTLEEFERQSLLLNNSKLTPLIITLPGGQKNNLEEIIRYFKYNPPINMSNTIKINIKNSGVNNILDQQQLSLDILQKINEELACPLTIKEIKFI